MEAGDGKAASLMRWLGVYAVTAQEDCVNIALRLLKTAFPDASGDLKHLNGWEAAVAILEGFYEASLAVDVEKLTNSSGELNFTLKSVLELVLTAVVQCEAKEKFVKDILAMEDAVQADLMTIIEKVMARGASILSDEPVQKEEKEKDKTKETSGLGSPLYLSRNSALEQAKRENGVLKEENIHLARELEEMTKQFCGVEVDKERLVETIQQLKEQLGSDVLRKERSLHAQYDERIQSLQHALNATKSELHEKAELAGKVPELRDEIDLLRPLAKKMKKIDATVAKYKAKIDELSGAKDSLRRLEGANAELVEKNLALESELGKAASWQRKLKDAKRANTAVEFRVSELETLLAWESQELAVARSNLEAAQGALHESKLLNTQLQESTHCQSSVDTTENESVQSAPPMACGISEFNPEIMEKLARLEYENAELKKQIDGEAAARIDGLLDEVDDMSRLKKSFEKKYFDTQQTLQATQSDLKQTKHDLECKVSELQAQICELSEWRQYQDEDILAQTLEKHTLVAERNHLAAELRHRTEREYQLTSVLSSRDREVAEVRESIKVASHRNKQLVEQCGHLSRVKEELEEILARQIECATMQVEDANAERDRLSRQYEKELDAKATEVERLQGRIQECKAVHDEERQQLENMNLSVAKELERYQELHTVSNADWSAKEEELNNHIQELQRQEQKLKSTVRSQLQSNARLVEKNKALKVDAVEKREMIARLESTATRLESKLSLLEKQRAHFSSQDKRKRNVEDGMSSYSSQLSTQVSLVVAELEKVLQENKDLLKKRVGCRCGQESPPRSEHSNSDQKVKIYYQSRIQQLDLDKQQIEHKRRELLLVNAKLIQEQKQLLVRNATLSNEVLDLEESVNHWRLRDERRRKNEDQPSLPLENKHSVASPPVERQSTQANGNSEQLATQERESRGSSVPNTEQSDTCRYLQDEPSLSTDEVSPSCTHLSRSVCTNGDRSKRRKLDEDYTTPETARPTSPADNNFADAQVFFSKPPAPVHPTSKSSSEPRSKRRLSHFITQTLAPDKTKQQTEKPSECKQQ